MKAKLLSVEGKTMKDITLPKHFEEPFRPDIIQRAVISSIAARTQPYGSSIMAGRQTTAEFQGRRKAYSASGSGQNKSMAQRPRLKNIRHGYLGKVAGIPEARGGTRAHPPKVGTIRTEKINIKERRLALRSAIAATANKEHAQARGHIVDGLTLPIIVESSFENLTKTKDVETAFSKLGVLKDVEKAKAKKNVRAGKGKARGRKYKRRKGPLVVVSGPAKIATSAKNLEGVEIVNVKNLNTELLAPGTHAGRLTIWTEGAIEALNKDNLFM